MDARASLVVVVTVLSAWSCGRKGAVPELPSKVVGHCTYVNGFSKLEECRDYLGDGWTDEDATEDCQDQRSTVVLGSGCGIDTRMGYCVLGADQRYTRITFPGDDASKCSSLKRGCEFFGGGIFDPSLVCGGEEPASGGTGLPTFEWPTLSCRDPKPGEPPGKSAGGQVCTWEMISAATEEGRDYEDYASCDRVRTQRPYYPAPTAPDATREDPRLADRAYVAELDWVKWQISSTACICCHSSKAPEGTSNWYVDQPGNFLNGFYDRGLAMGAGWVDTVGFGAFPAEQNNRFLRATPEHPDESIFVTTDQPRMKRFFENELSVRGLTRQDFASQPYGAGPLDEQRFYTPAACERGEGVGADGILTWRQGPARYVYVLEAGASSPGVPPNLDLPQGTVWRIDVPATGTPVASGAVKYGVTPEGFLQRAPAAGTPAPLVSGRQYYLYVLADIAIPNTRCLFTAP